MKCGICDRDLSDTEVIYNPQLPGFEPCGTCLDVAFDAAFSDGFVRPDDQLPEDVEFVELDALDPGFDEESYQRQFNFMEESHDF